MKPLDHKNLDLDVPYFANVVRYLSTNLFYRICLKIILKCLFKPFYDIFIFICSIQHNRKPGCLYLGLHGKASPSKHAV